MHVLAAYHWCRAAFSRWWNRRRNQRSAPQFAYGGVLKNIDRNLAAIRSLAEVSDHQRRVEVEWQYMVNTYGPEVGHQVKVEAVGCPGCADLGKALKRVSTAEGRA